MKGGVTSGVVYPAAILKLAEQCRFRSVGGASAGAIAAAATVAAEYGRDGEGGFAAFEKMKEELSSEGFLLKLIQPSKDGKPIFDTLLFIKGAWERRPQPASKLTLAWHFRTEWKAKKMGPSIRACGEVWHKGVGSGLVPAGVLSLVVLLPWALLAVLNVPFLWLRMGILVALLLGAVALLIAGARTGRVVAQMQHSIENLLSPASSFGLCPGYSESGESLTAWVHRQIQEMAGLAPGEPLTMQHLRTKHINFKAVTSDLSQGQPYALPLDAENKSFIFCKKDMDALFPAEVVKWLVEHAPKHKKIELPEGFHILPMSDNLPVLVAMRMSLSFPVLLSAVRLYTVKNSFFAQVRKHPDRNVPTVGDMDIHWFSDGGIASNFPIHVFDSWMPRRPTLGINLRDMILPGKRANPRVDGNLIPSQFPEVVLPRPADVDLAREPVVRIDGIGDFLGAVFETAQSYRDNMQAALPGYRERIAHVYLSAKEGGLNLEMNPESIEKIAERGEEVARLFASFNFSEHQWVRLLALMSRIEVELEVICKHHGTTEESFRKLREDFAHILEGQKVAFHLGDEAKWYRPVDPKDTAWFSEANNRLDALVALMETWAIIGTRVPGPHPSPLIFFAHKSPHPAGMLRLTPDL
jgi:predicted acylesterase/phospholipase RssA